MLSATEPVAVAVYALRDDRYWLASETSAAVLAVAMNCEADASRPSRSYEDDPIWMAEAAPSALREMAVMRMLTL